MINLQVPERVAYLNSAWAITGASLLQRVYAVEQNVRVQALAVNVGLKCPEGPQACGWALRRAGRAPESWRAAQRQRENRNREQLDCSHTSKGPDRMHKSTVAAQIRAEHRSVSQTATPNVMRGQNLKVYSFSLLPS